MVLRPAGCSRSPGSEAGRRRGMSWGGSRRASGPFPDLPLWSGPPCPWGASHETHAGSLLPPGRRHAHHKAQSWRKVSLAGRGCLRPFPESSSWWRPGLTQEASGKAGGLGPSSWLPPWDPSMQGVAERSARRPTDPCCMLAVLPEASQLVPWEAVAPDRWVSGQARTGKVI